MKTRLPNGRFASPIQKAKNDAMKWHSNTQYLLSIMEGNYKAIRRLTEENRQLKADLQRCRLPVTEL